ncbi:hypothetical protein FB446DRAFT_708500 [Lentinula raphanica]|nr:hypothetical protein FB446DRAFT_708500 [Lentinula raphanica]
MARPNLSGRSRSVTECSALWAGLEVRGLAASSDDRKEQSNAKNLEAPPTMSCFRALNYLQTGPAHLFPIDSTPGYALIRGWNHCVLNVTEEIVDAPDRYEDHVSKRKAVTAMIKSDPYRIVGLESKRVSFGYYKSNKLVMNLAGGAGYLSFGTFGTFGMRIGSG